MTCEGTITIINEQRYIIMRYLFCDFLYIYIYKFIYMLNIKLPVLKKLYTLTRFKIRDFKLQIRFSFNSSLINEANPKFKMQKYRSYKQLLVFFLSSENPDTAL